MEVLSAATYSEVSKLTVFTGAIPPDSAFYVERSPIETECYNAILKPGALIRIKGAKQLGKTSLVARILFQAAQQGFQTVALNLQEIEATVLQTLDSFLQWFCIQISHRLQLSDRLSDYWDDLFGSTISCKSYFEEYLLLQTPQPLVLVLDDIDRLFAYPDVADEFFGLLRAWHEESKNRAVWQRLRLIVTHTTEVYIPLNIHKSPFNVGLPIELNGLTGRQIQDLADRYGYRWSNQFTEALIKQIAGHPYLVQTLLHYLQQADLPQQPTALEELLSSSSLNFVYYDHLQQQEQSLVHDPSLAATFAQVIQSPIPVQLELTQALKLQSLGLVTLQGFQAMPSCELYRCYFGDRWNSDLTQNISE